MSKIMVFLIKIYQSSPFRAKNSCRFLPTCSEYGKQAFLKYSFLRAFRLTSVRIFKCHPWTDHKYDPLP